MPSEKELNCALFDQLAIVERIEKAAKNSNIDEIMAALKDERHNIERKLYQKPPLSADSD